MKILTQKLKVKRGHRVKVHFDKATKVWFMPKSSFFKYRDGVKRYRTMGGDFNPPEAEFTVSFDGDWYVVVERGSHFNPVDINARVEVLPPEIKLVDPFADEDIPSSDESSTAEDPVDESSEESEEDEETEEKESIE